MNPTSGFNIRVGSAPTSGLNLQHDIDLVKSSILYADKVKLSSMKVSMFLLLAMTGDMTTKGFMAMLKECAGALGTDPGVMEMAFLAYKNLSQKKFKTRSEILALKSLEETLAKSKKEIRDKIEEILINSNMSELLPAVNEGILELEVLNVSGDDAVHHYFDSISQELIDGKSYLLLDDATSNLVSTAIRDKKVIPLPTSEARSKQASLSSNLLDRLPNLSNASMKDILEVRKELSKYLIRFRANINEFSNQISVAPWDTDFKNEIDGVYRNRVLPVILDIEEQIKSNSFILKMFKAATEKPLILPSTSALGMLVANATEVPKMLSQAVAISAGLTAIAAESVVGWVNEKKSIEKSGLYFYYKATEKFG
jgi:hypothetical protein